MVMKHQNNATELETMKEELNKLWKQFYDNDMAVRNLQNHF